MASIAYCWENQTLGIEVFNLQENHYNLKLATFVIQIGNVFAGIEGNHHLLNLKD